MLARDLADLNVVAWGEFKLKPEQEVLVKSLLDGKDVLLVFTYHVIKPKNRNDSINKVTNKGYDRYINNFAKN